MKALELAQQFISIDSVTSHSNREISSMQAAMLEQLGFAVERLHFRDVYGTDKISLAACKQPAVRSNCHGIAFFCHNDVVSVDGWNCMYGGPFDAAVADGRLWGRGACDMKGPMACAFAALQALGSQTSTTPIYFVITGDEECGMAGARTLVQSSEVYRQLTIDQPVCLVCEPTELKIVNAHKGGCHFDVSSRGVAAHSSTQNGLNANWQIIPYLSYLRDVARRCETELELKNDTFSTPTLSLNVVIENEPAAFNITVGRAKARIFFRPMPDTAWQPLMEEMKAKARDMELEVSSIRCLPPLNTPVDRSSVQTALRLAGQTDPSSVCFATDGCCFEELHDLLVLGPGSIEQAHRCDEWIDLQQLSDGADLYAKFLRHYAYSPSQGSFAE